MARNFRVTCLVDDSVMLYKKYWGEHGLAFLVETQGSTALFDTGASPEILAHNLNVLQKDPGTVGSIALSHAHRDHTGALAWVLQHTRRPLLVASPALFIEKYSRREGSTYPMGMTLTRAELEQQAELRLTDNPYPLAEGLFVSGQIPHCTPFEIPDPHMVVRTAPGDAGDEFSPDLFPDDRSLVMDTGDGLALLAGCCHTGLVNTLRYAALQFQKPVHTVIGGIHLNEASSEQIEQTIAAVRRDHNIRAFYLNHCTGERAVQAFRSAWGDKVKSCPAGTQIIL